jgi:hypothetical protein
MSAALTYRLELADGNAAEPPTFQTTTYNWRRGDTIFIARGRTLRVIETRPAAEPEGDPVLVVEEDGAGADTA